MRTHKNDLSEADRQIDWPANNPIRRVDSENVSACGGTVTRSGPLDQRTSCTVSGGIATDCDDIGSIRQIKALVP